MQLWGTSIAPKWSICPEQDFFWSTTNIILITISFTINKHIMEKLQEKHDCKALNFKQLLIVNKKFS